MYLTLLLFVTCLFFIGTFFLTAFSSAFRKLYKQESKKIQNELIKNFFYRNLHLYFFPKQEYNGIIFALTCALTITRFILAISLVYLLYYSGGLVIHSPEINQTGELSLTFPLGLLSSFGFLAMYFFLGDFLPRVIGTKYSESIILYTSFIVSVFLLLAFPFAFIFFKLTQSSSQIVYFDHMQEPVTQAQQELLEIFQEANLTTQLDPHVKKLIESVILFRDRIAREVMVPRVDVFGLAAEVTIKEASNLLLKEGYSRIPVYRQSMDNIIGVLMYKDVLAKYMEYELKGDPKILNAPVESIIKNVLYTPETKKISSLLQEFRKKQVHLAIVVDEYGGTEGIVTIEDILEEIVGDISDEYDKEELLFVALPDGGWIVDARMGILDVEEQLGISIPQEGDYDTIGGYIFHYAGAIPSKGFKIKQGEFEIEVLRSNDRCVEKVKVKVIKQGLAS